MTAKNEERKTGYSLGVGARRVIAYIVLVLLTILCLFWFYLLFVNATRSKAQLNQGFTLIPSHYAFRNLYNLFHNSNLPILRGLLNSFFVAISAAALSSYFSAMTAYAIHAYDFKLKNAAFTFILAIMMIPTQVTALGFLSLLRRIGPDVKVGKKARKYRYSVRLMSWMSPSRTSMSACTALKVM